MAQQLLMEKLSAEISAIIERVSQSIVVVQGRRFPASGIVWQKDLIVTTDHSLPKADGIQIRTSAGEVISATIAGRDPSTDIALLRTTAQLQPLQSAGTDPLKAGQLTVSLGRANGGRPLAVLTMISGTDGAYRNWRGGTLDQFIRLDAAPFPGFSGSALILPDGKVAGMNTSVFSRHFGLTVPASNIERVVQRLSEKGYFGKPYLGVMMQPVRLPEKIRKVAGAEFGLLVMGTESGSPAEEAGLLIGDILVRLNEKPLNSMDEIHDLLTEDSIGKEMKIGIVRAGKLEELKVKVGERPSQKRKD
jgi:S1-C subfamily serine protease